MPIYEYLCGECGETVEKIQSQSREEISCPSCGGRAERSVSVFSAGGQGSVAGGYPPMPGSGFG